MKEERTVPRRTADGKIEMIAEWDFYDRLKWERTDADEYRPKCCGGLGYVRMARPVGDPMFGQVIRCETCRPRTGQ